MPARHIADLAGTRRSQFRINPDLASGPPTSGYHAAGEIHTDADAAVWSCVASGTPGTWRQFNVVVGGQTLSLPVSTTIVDSLNGTVYRTAKWIVEMRKGTKSSTQEIVATHNDTIIKDQRPVSFKVGTGALDFDIDVDYVSSTIELSVTPDTTGWGVTWRRLYVMEA